MGQRFGRGAFFLAAAFSAAACAPTAASIDGGAGNVADAGTPGDAADGGTVTDGGTLADAGARADGGSSTDGGSSHDGGATSDGGGPGRPSSWAAWVVGGPFYENSIREMTIAAGEVQLAIEENALQGSNMSNVLLMNAYNAGAKVWSQVVRATNTAGVVESTDSVNVLGMATDDMGSSYVLLQATGVVHTGGLGSTAADATGDRLHLVRFAADGTPQWIYPVERSVVDPNSEHQGWIAVNPTGGGCYAYNSTQDTELSIGCFSQNGTRRWASGAAPSTIPSFIPGGLVVDAAGNAYLATYNANFTSLPDLNQIFVTSFDANGQVRWTKAISGATGNGVQAFTVSPLGNVYVVAWLSGTPTIAGQTLDLGSGTWVLASYTGAGADRWAQVVGGTPGTIAEEAPLLALDGEAAYLVGSFHDSVSFGSATLTAPVSPQVYVARFDGAGSLAWARSSTAEVIEALCVGPGGTLYLGGRFQGSATFGSMTVRAPSEGLFFAGYDVSGDVVLADLAAEGVGTTPAFTEMRCATDGQVFFAGKFDLGLRVGGGAVQLAPNGQGSAFVAVWHP
jgi:hypothetical protein